MPVKFLKLQVIFIFSLCFLLLALNYPDLPKPKTSAKVEDLFPLSSKELSAFNETEKVFGKEVVDAVVFDISKLDQNDLDDVIFEIDDAISYISGVLRVSHPLSASSKFLKKNQFYSKDGKYVRFFIHYDRGLDEKEQKRVNAELKEVLVKLKYLNPKRTGAFYLSLEVNKAIEEERERQLPFCALLLAFGFFIVFKKNVKSSNKKTSILSAIILPIKVAVAPALSLAVMVLTANVLNIRLGSISQLCLPFVLAVSSSYSVHVASRVLNDKSKEASNELLMSILLAFVTTAIGLLSMLFMDTKGVTQFALISTFGIALGAWFSLVITKYLLLKEVEDSNKFFSFTLSKGLAKTISLLIILLSILFSFYIFKINIHTEPLDFLPKKSPAYSETLELNKIFKGNHQLSIIYKAKNGKLNQDLILSLGDFQNHLEKIDGVENVFSSYDFLKQQNLNDAKEFSLTLGELGPKDLVSEDTKIGRILVFHDKDGSEILELAESINSLISQSNIDKLSFELSGLELVLASHSKHLLVGVLESILFTVVIVVILLFFLTRSFRYVVIGLIPNVIPVISVLGAIGLFYGSMNLGSALVSVAALSIAVDGTFHIFLSWDSLKNSSKDSLVERKRKLLSPIKAILLTTAILVLGFSPMIFSDVLPIEQFSVLLSVSLIVGALCDLVILPMLLEYAYSKENR